MKPRSSVLSRRLFSTLPILLTLTSAPSFAEEESWAFEPITNVISASRINQSVLSAPNPVTIIDAAMIEASGYIYLADIFRLVPGMYVAYVGGRKYAVSYHGGTWANTNWMQVLVNGRSTFMPNSSVIDWDTIGVQLEDIERIEVIRGPSASAYGSNSFSAAINIITKPIAIDDQWQVKTRFGSDGDQRNYAKLRTKLGSADVRATLNTEKSDGFDEGNDFKDIYTGSLSYEQSLDAQNQLSGYLTFATGETGPLLNPNVVDQERDREIQAYSGHLVWERDLVGPNAFQFQVFHHSSDENDQSLTPPVSALIPFDLTGTPFADNADEQFIVGRELFYSEKTQADFQFNAFNSSSIRNVLIGGLRHDFIHSPSYFSENVSREEVTGFLGVNSEIQLSTNIDLNLGLLAEKQPNYQAFFSPRASLNLLVSPSQSIRLSYSAANRLPTLLEKHQNSQLITSDGDILNKIYIQDTKVQPEHIEQLEVGYTGKSRQHQIDWGLSAYHTQYENTIWYNFIADPTDISDGFYHAPINAGAYQVSGIEGEFTFRASQYHFYKVFFNVAQDDEQHSIAKDPDIIIKSRDKTPAKSLGLMGSWQWKNVNGSLIALYVDEMNWKWGVTSLYPIGGYSGQPRETVDEYFRLDANLRATFSLGETQISLQAGAQNLTGGYKEFDEQITVDPRYYMSLSVSSF